jgi:hypothetical protein
VDGLARARGDIAGLALFDLAWVGVPVALVGIGVTFGGSTVLPEAGTLALVALLAGFVLLMAGVGTYLMRAKDEP